MLRSAKEAVQDYYCCSYSTSESDEEAAAAGAVGWQQQSNSFPPLRVFHPFVGWLHLERRDTRSISDIFEIRGILAAHQKIVDR